MAAPGDPEIFPPRPVPDGTMIYAPLTGMLIPWATRAPVLIHLLGSEAFYLPVFSTEEQLHSFMQMTTYVYDSIKMVENGVEFLESIPLRSPEGLDLIVIQNPRVTEEGRVRFFQIAR